MDDERQPMSAGPVRWATDLVREVVLLPRTMRNARQMIEEANRTVRKIDPLLERMDQAATSVDDVQMITRAIGMVTGQNLLRGARRNAALSRRDDALAPPEATPGSERRRGGQPPMGSGH